jgi:hypothetical protein
MSDEKECDVPDCPKTEPCDHPECPEQGEMLSHFKLPAEWVSETVKVFGPDTAAVLLEVLKQRYEDRNKAQGLADRLGGLSLKPLIVAALKQYKYQFSEKVKEGIEGAIDQLIAYFETQ